MAYRKGEYIEMKKILVFILATLMCISLCACGGNESASGDNKDGITPNQPTETTEQKDTETQQEEKSPSDMTVEEMKNYYDPEKFLGTPRLVNAELYDAPNEVIKVIDRTVAEYMEYEIAVPEGAKASDFYGMFDVIICDNNTPDDYTDDVVAYIFTE